MRKYQFDPFGETLQIPPTGEVRQGRASQVALRLGVGVFWSLVAVIVTARVVYFDPGAAKTFWLAAAHVLSSHAPV
jgi:hypothetical protein